MFYLKISKNTSSVLSFIFFFLNKQKYAFYTLFLTALVWGINQNVFPIFIKWVLNIIEQDKIQHKHLDFTFPALFIIADLMIMMFSMRIQGLVSAKVFPRLISNIKNHALSKVYSYHYDYFSKVSPTVITSEIICLSGSVERFVQIFIFSILSIFISISISLFLYSMISFVLAFLLLFWFLSHLLVTIFFLNRAKSFPRNKISSSKTIGEFFSGLTTVWFYNRFFPESLLVKNSNLAEEKQYKISLLNLELMKMVLGVLAVAFVSVVLIELYALYVANRLSMGDFALVVMIAFGSMNFVWNMSFQVGSCLREYALINNALNLLNLNRSEPIVRSVKSHSVDHALLEFENISFSYANKIIFSNFNLIINASEKVGVFGGSGVGKTTLMHLLLGLHAPLSGEISIGGHNISSYSKADLYDSISVVSQDAYLFNRSVKDNIVFGNPLKSFADVETVCKLVCAHDFIIDFQNGYSTIVGENGALLSKGQKQRLLLARALLKDALIYVFDEPLSGVDSPVRKKIYKNLFYFLQKKTVILISHDSYANSYLDRIVDLNNYNFKNVEQSLSNQGAVYSA